MDGKVLRRSFDGDLGEDGKPLDKPVQQQLSKLDTDSGTVSASAASAGRRGDATRAGRGGNQPPDFAFHSVLDHLCDLWRKARARRVPRRDFFWRMRVLTEYFALLQ